MIVPGLTFLSRNPKNSTRHLFIVISSIIDEKVLLVNVTSKKENNDHTCVLDKGDHPFVRHDSIINYAEAIEGEVCLMREAFATKIFEVQKQLSATLLKKVQEGALISLEFKPKFRKYIPSQ